MIFDQVMSVIFLIAVLALVLPAFLSTNKNLQEFFKKFVCLDCNCDNYYCNHLFN